MNKKIDNVGILGIGSAVPEKVLTNFDLEKIVDTSDEWIVKRTGIHERRVLETNEPAYTYGIMAAESALKSSGIEASEIGLIITTTETPDYLSPSTSCLIQHGIGAINAAAFDLSAACSGFVYGLTVAKQFIQTGYYKHVLVVACEGITKVVDWTDRGTCVLFGDGAGAAVVGEVEEGYGILNTHIGADGSQGNCIKIPGCYAEEIDPGEIRKYIHMEGGEVFKFAVKIMEEATLKVLEGTGISLDDISLIIPHQANQRIIEGAGKRLGVPIEKIVSTLGKYGNNSSASIPVALNDVLKNSESIKKGDYIVLVAFGGGLTWSSALIKWNM